LLLVGKPSLMPRLAPVPVRMPLPPAEHQGSIHENQCAAGRRFFETARGTRTPRGGGQTLFAARLVGAGPGLGWP
jgi:hypothetical protein